MKSKKVTMLAAALVVAVVAAAGIGYAVNSYTGTTSNGGNAAEVTYVKLSQGGTGAYDNTNSFIGSEYFNTVTTSATVTTYTVTGTQSVEIGETSPVTAYVISKAGALQLIVDGTDDTATYQLDISTTTDLSSGDNKISYYFGIKKGEAAIVWSAVGTGTSPTTWTIENVTEGTYDVYVAAAGQSTTQPVGFTGTTFNFVVSAPMA